MERILFIMQNMGLGGAETHIMKVYRKIDKDLFQFDFILTVKDKCYYEDEILALGGKVYRITPKKESIIKNYKELKYIVSSNKYLIVFKCGDHAFSWTEMLSAKNGGAKKRIMRSTNSQGSNSRLNNLLHVLSRIPLNLLVTDRVAPSKVAAEWLFGKIKSKEAILINNGLEYNNYSFSPEWRAKIRDEFNIPKNAVVIGHVGRFFYQKNHKFLIDIFEEYRRENENAMLLLIGEGEMRSEIEKIVHDYHIESKVLFTGNRNDVPHFYSAMDILAFPSLFEGMPNVVIEAQASGLPCIISDTISRDADITGTVSFLSLDDHNAWVEAIKNSDLKRKDTRNDFIAKGYDMDSVVNSYIRLFVD